MWRAAGGSAAATLALLLLPLPTALAASIHTPAGSFGAATSTPPNPYPLGSPGAVAVDDSSGGGASVHDLYATDPAHFRIEKFDSAGQLLLMFGKEVNKSKVEASAGEAEENVCVIASGDECQSGAQGSGGKGQLSAPAFVAVDSSSGASSGDVYVGDRGTNVVYKFSSGGAFLSENDGTGSGEEHFTGVDGVAVDTAGNLWVFDQHPGPSVFRFDEAGTFIPGLFATGGARPGGLTVDGSGASYLVEGFEAVEKLGPDGKKVGRVLPGPLEGGPIITGLIADQLTNDLYLDTGPEIDHIAPSCDPSKGFCQIADSFGFPELIEGAGLGIDTSSATVYAADSSTGTVDRFTLGFEAQTGKASEVQAGSATLEATLNPEGSTVSECVFEYGTSTEYGQSAACEETVGSGTSPVAVHAKLKDLQGGSTYHFRIFAKNANGAVRGEDETLKTLTTPTIDEAAATNVTATAAELTAKINPHAIASEYHFEYDTSPYLQGEASHGTSVPLPAQSIGAGSGDVAVSQAIEGLSANTTYHFRVVVKDAPGDIIESPDHTFVFIVNGPEPPCANEALRGGPSAKLPDCRGYELVTPAQKNSALIGALLFGQVPPQISEDGTRVSVPSIQCFDEAKSCTASRQSEGQPYEFTRASGSWTATALAPPAGELGTDSWWSFGASAGTALFSIESPPNGQDDFYLRKADGSFARIGPIGEGATAFNALDFQPLMSSSDPEVVIYGTKPAWSFDHGESNATSIYEYKGSGNAAPALVGVSGGAGSSDLISACGTGVNFESQSFSRTYNPISADGRIVFFAASRCATGTGENAGREVPAGELYERIDESRTVKVSAGTPEGCASAACKGAPPSDAVFEGASSDGTKVFFTSTQQLSDEASEDRNAGDSATSCANTSPSASGCNLYESECPGHCEDPSQRKLIDLSVGAPSGGPRVQGAIAISPDGTHVYFIAKGALTTAENKQGKRASDGANNLYLYERDEAHPQGRLSFVTALSPADRQSWALRIGLQGLAIANVSPDGRFLTFESHRGLTPDAKVGDGPTQIYRYDAESEEMTRISIGQAGFADDGKAGKAGASIAPAYRTFIIGNGPARANPTMSSDGRYVFFQSPAALTPGALSEVKTGGEEPSGADELAQNIYEWEQEGTGGCEEAQGCVSLISDGKDTSASGKIEIKGTELLGASASGQDVFLATNSQLTAKDTDTQRDYYDARVGGGEEAPESPVTCEGDECRPPPPPPPVFGPLTSTLIGPGGNLSAEGSGKAGGGSGPGRKVETNAQKLTKALKVCHRKHSRAKRLACERQARRRFAPKHRSKARRGSHR